MIEFEIRDEQGSDLTAVDSLVTAAFGSDGDTARFVDEVRRKAKVCLAEVALADGMIVGQAQWCDAPVIVDGGRVKGAYLTELSARPELQRRGIGSRLVRNGLRRLKDNGYEVATLLGDPDYYARFGFSPVLAERIEARHRSRGRGFQAIELVAGALDGRIIRAEFPDVIAPE